MIRIPTTLEAEIDALVAQGIFATRDEAASELIRLGLDTLRRRAPRPPAPGPPPMPPGVGEVPPPGDDEPISVDPRDSRWL